MVNGWADHVFSEGQQAAGASEIAALQMQKIEELTLYMIELKKENEQLNKRLAALENK